MLKGPSDYLQFGSWNCICQRCGVKRKAEDISKEWTGLLVCTTKCLDQRHPQDFVKSVKDDQTVPYTSPEPTDVTVSVTYDTEVGVQEHIIPTGTFDGSL